MDRRYLLFRSSNPTNPVAHTRFLQHTVHICAPLICKGLSVDPQESKPASLAGAQKGLTPLKGIAKTGMCRLKLSSVRNLILKFTVRVFEAEQLTGS